MACINKALTGFSWLGVGFCFMCMCVVLCSHENLFHAFDVRGIFILYLQFFPYLFCTFQPNNNTYSTVYFILLLTIFKMQYILKL